MKQHLPEEFSTRLIHWGPFVIMGNTVPPRETCRLYRAMSAVEGNPEGICSG